MANRESVTIFGHVTNDLYPNRMGGSAAYASAALRRLGTLARVFTKLPPGHEYIANLQTRGVAVYPLQIADPQKRETITTFDNRYDSQGQRTQVVLAQQEAITAQDVQRTSTALFQNTNVIVGPVLDEIDTETMRFLKEKQNNHIVLIAQGYFRQVDTHGTVTQKRWTDFAEVLQYADVTIFSEEDITINGSFDAQLLDEVIKSAHRYQQTVILTRGFVGATIFQPNQQPVKVGAFYLEENETKDFTGAGDVFVAAFLWATHHLRDTRQAAVFACLFAAVKIIGIGGMGIDAIPTKDEFNEYVRNNRKRVETYLKEQDAGIEFADVILA